MRMFLAEKPSLARAIADVLPGPQKRTRDRIECGEGNVVAWCVGHILEPVMPEEYDPKYKTWCLGDLPIVPPAWKLKPSTPALLQSLRALLKQATRVVHAGDPDREGQLLVDEVLTFLGYKGPVDRVLISDTNPDAVRRQLAALEPNAKYRPLGDSALARQRADWLYGLNMSRLYTLLGQKAGYRGVLSVGRVQTPLLGLIVRRDLAIEAFRPVAYYAVSATLQTAAGETFRARWVPSAAAESHVDDRLVSQEVAEDVRQRTAGKGGHVAVVAEDRKSEAPPLPYSLADVQIDAARRLGMSAKDVLDACQRLYETHRLTTYPRSDCAYLPEGHHAQGKAVLEAIAKHAPCLAPLLEKADLSLRSRAWNDKKVTAHHAIVPTALAVAAASLSPTDRAVYELIARRYISQFLAAFEHLQTRLEVEIGPERFVATGRQALSAGWKVALTDAPVEEADPDADPDTAPLPRLARGDALTASEVTVVEKQTKPPKPFTDASLMHAMVNVASFVTSPEAKKILSDADGLGTPATRPAIIEALFQRHYVRRCQKTIVSTSVGRSLIKGLPDVATTPDLTAVWEAAMRAITEGKQGLDPFLARIAAQIHQLVEQGKAAGPLVLEAQAPTDVRHAGTPLAGGRKPAALRRVK